MNSVPTWPSSHHRNTKNTPDSNTFPVGASAQLRADDVGMTLGVKELFTSLSLTVNSRSRIALVGENGRGKSTLLHVLAGLVPPTTGTVKLVGNLGLSRQEMPAESGETVGSLIAEVLAAPLEALAELDEATTALAASTSNTNELSETEADAYAAALDRATQLDAWDAQRRIDEALAALHACTDRSRELNSLSVGQRYRVRLACLLGTPHDFLLLDEPTNHLDADGLQFLTERIRRWDGGVVLVSHDRLLLRQVAEVFVDLDPSADGEVRVFAGGYAAWEEGRRSDFESWQQKYDEQQAEHARLTQAFDQARSRLSTSWRPDKGTGKHQRQSHAPGVVRQLNRDREALEQHRITVPQPPVRLHWPDLPVKRGTPLIRCDRVTVVGRLTVPRSVELTGGDRLLVTGPNGAGKSTMLAVLAGQLDPDSGEVRRTRQARVAVVAQETRGLPPELTAYQAYRQLTDRWVSEGRVAQQQLVGLGATGLLDSHAQRTPVDRMSEGQRRRLDFALALATAPNVLILDEPTNHLSALLVDELTEALQKTQAAVVVATHDRQLLRDLASWPRLELQEG